MFDTLIDKVNKLMAQMQFDLSRCYDVYRLEKLLHDFKLNISHKHEEALIMVNELENKGNSHG